ncbi:MAG: YfcE family phosphodiesterase [Spirochaetes bacterium]|nr:YfcE family phosphodiesterase [Spirochaetota bacterium]
MSRILVVSDSHGSHVKLGRIIDREYPFDYLVHCGDGADDLSAVAVPGGVTVVSVYGNMDHGRGAGAERTVFFTAGTLRVMVSHGDRYHVHNDLEWIEREGRSRGADIVLFGHTHVKYFCQGKPSLFNPGPANRGQYGIVDIDGKPRFSHHSLED